MIFILGGLTQSEFDYIMRMLFDIIAGIYMNFDKLLFGLIKSIPSDDLMQFVFDLNYNLFD